MIFLKELAMRRRSLLPLLVILMFLFPLLQAGNSPAKGLDGRQQSMVLVAAYTPPMVIWNACALPWARRWTPD